MSTAAAAAAASEDLATDASPARVLILAPTTKDAAVTRALLCGEGIACLECHGLPCLADAVAQGAGAVLTTEEAIVGDGVESLIDVLRRQPAWSKIPIVILTREARQSPVATSVLQALDNVTVLERPAPMRTVVSAVRAALRERQRQYQIRDQIRQIERLLASERDARSEAERANRLKDEFLATVSHELRTPLSAILLWARMLENGHADEDERRDAVAAIVRGADAQKQLIEDLLDMSRMMSGKLRLDARDTDLAPVVEAAAETVRPAAEARGVRLSIVVDDDCRGGDACVVRGDPDRLQQVVWNLLSNAVKFTPEGGRVDVRLSRRGETGTGPARARVTVADTGKGIEREFLPHLFERFRQADASMTRRHGGLGLGLALTLQLVELHGGTIRAESEGPGRGATFTVELPTAGARRPPAATPPPAAPRESDPDTNGPRPLAGVRVLLVEDEDETRSALSWVLQRAGARVETATSAPDALDRLRRRDGTPDVLVSDIGMPDEDGYSLIRKARQLSAERGQPRLPALALTAYARAEDRDHALAAGFEAYAAKPVEPDELLRAVASLVGREA